MEKGEGGKSTYVRLYVHPLPTRLDSINGYGPGTRAGERASDSFDLYIPPCLAGMKGVGQASRVRGMIPTGWLFPAKSCNPVEG